MKRSLIVSKRAQRDIKRIDATWIQNRPLATDLFYLELRDMFDLLARQPHIGHRYPARAPGVRRVLLRGSRYHVYYKTTPKQIHVVAVWGAVRERGPKL